jgi:hypothetical protein
VAAGVTPEPAAPEGEELTHLADDPELEFNFLDAGTLQFRIPADRLARDDYTPCGPSRAHARRVPSP